jgi:hypothetical protein
MSLDNTVLISSAITFLLATTVGCETSRVAISEAAAGGGERAASELRAAFKTLRGAL